MGYYVNINIATVEALLNQKINSNYDQSSGDFKPNDPTGFVTSQINDLLTQIMNLTLLGSIFLILLLLIVFSNNYIFIRKRELAIFRSKGMTTFNSWRLLLSQLILIIAMSLIWGFLNSIAFSISIFNYSYPQQLLPMMYSIKEYNLLLMFTITISSLIITFFTSLRIFRYNLLNLLKRSI